MVFTSKVFSLQLRQINNSIKSHRKRDRMIIFFRKMMVNHLKRKNLKLRKRMMKMMGFTILLRTAILMYTDM